MTGTGVGVATSCPFDEEDVDLDATGDDEGDVAADDWSEVFLSFFEEVLCSFGNSFRDFRAEGQKNEINDSKQVLFLSSMILGCDSCVEILTGRQEG